MSIKLNALLLAKLLTESYPGSTSVALSHPGFAHNPLSLNLDPDFYKLNPGLDLGHWSESAATLLVNSTSSQVMYQLSSYIAADPKAMAFINGKPEHDGPYTMRVNPAYQHLRLPVDSWPQLDTWQFKAAPNSCLKAQGNAMPPYMPLIANPVTSLQLVAQAMLYNWPNVETGCTGTGTQDDPYQLGRVAPQGLGNRFMLGLVTLGDAQRYGLTTAKLQAAPGHYVASDSAGIKAALSLAGKTSKLRPFDLTQAEIRRSRTAYPGSMLVYTAAKTYGLPAATAQHVAQFIRVSSTEGQKPGRGNGQLAAGYVPIGELRGDPGALPAGAGGRGRGGRPEGAADAAREPAPKPPAGPPAGPSQGGPPGVLPGDAPPGSTPSTEPARSTRRRHDDGRGRGARQDRGGLRRRRRAADPADRGLCRRRGRGDRRPDRAVEQGTAMSTPTLAPPARPQAPHGRPIRPGEAAETLYLFSSACTIVALICLWMLLQMIVLGRFSEARAQHLLYTEYRSQLATETAPTGALDYDGKPVVAGSPVALMSIPAIGLHDVVVVDGTDLRQPARRARATCAPPPCPATWARRW